MLYLSNPSYPEIISLALRIVEHFTDAASRKANTWVGRLGNRLEYKPRVSPKSCSFLVMILSTNEMGKRSSVDSAMLLFSNPSYPEILFFLDCIWLLIPPSVIRQM